MHRLPDAIPNPRQKANALAEGKAGDGAGQPTAAAAVTTAASFLRQLYYTPPLCQGCHLGIRNNNSSFR